MTTTQIKLSFTQKEIIGLMIEGEVLYTIFYFNGSPNVIKGRRVSEATFSKLSNMGLITIDKTTQSKGGLERTYWKLTDLAKDIKL